MFGHFKTLAAAIVTLLIGAPVAESIEFVAEAGEERIETTVQNAGDRGISNIMGDVI